jgi:hypothetical protein
MSAGDCLAFIEALDDAARAERDRELNEVKQELEQIKQQRSQYKITITMTGDQATAGSAGVWLEPIIQCWNIVKKSDPAANLEVSIHDSRYDDYLTKREKNNE